MGRPMHTTGPGPGALLLGCLLLAGCDAMHYRSALRENSVQAYRRYLARHPGGHHTAQARGRLEQQRYFQARRADRPLGYRLYLQEYPDGAHDAACRARLAGLALKQATTGAQLELILELHPDSREAREAERRLPALLAREALQRRDPSLCVRFLDRFPQSAGASNVRAHLAALRYPSVPNRLPELEAFIQELGGTPQGKQALVRLERLMIHQVQESLTPADLDQLRARFPDSAALPRLRQSVRRQQLWRALGRVDLEALRRMNDPEAEQLVRWCRETGQARCDALRRLAQQAAAWAPTRPIKDLCAGTYAADPQDAWLAITHLSFSRSVRAGEQLLELMGSARLSTIWITTSALDRWLLGLTPGRRGQWIQQRLARAHHPANDDEVQRRAHLLLLGNAADEGLAQLRRLASHPSRMLSAGYLMAHWERRQRPTRPPSREALQRLSTGAHARVIWLKDAFPVELHEHSLFSGVLVERETFGLLGALDQIRGGIPGGGAAGLEEARVEARTLLQDWRRRLVELSKRFTPASQPNIAPVVEHHEQGREAALRQLVRSSSGAGRLVARSLCGDRTAGVCAGWAAKNTGEAGNQHPASAPHGL